MHERQRLIHTEPQVSAVKQTQGCIAIAHALVASMAGPPCCALWVRPLLVAQVGRLPPAAAPAWLRIMYISSQVRSATKDALFHAIVCSQG